VHLMHTIQHWYRHDKVVCKAPVPVLLLVWSVCFAVVLTRESSVVLDSKPV